MQVIVTISADGGADAAAQAKDISAYANKKPVKIESLTPLADKPLLFAVIVDTSKSENGRADVLRETCSHVFSALSKGQSRGYLVLVNNQFTISKTPLTTDQVDAALDNLRLGGGTVLFDAMLKTIEGPLSRAVSGDNPRRALIVISDGVDTMSAMAPLDTVLDAAVREGVPIYALRSWPDYTGLQRGEGNLRKSSEKTGGVSAFARSDTDSPVLEILSAVKDQYLLTFTPQEIAPGKMQSLKVRSNNRKYSVAAPPAFEQ